VAVPFEYPSENISGMFGLVQHVNNITSGTFGIVLLLIVFVLSFITTRSVSPSRSIGFSVFITFLSAILIRYMGLINDGILYIAIVLLVGCGIWIWYSKSEDLNV